MIQSEELKLFVQQMILIHAELEKLSFLKI